MPPPSYSPVHLQAFCVYLFTLEYFGRLLTVWAVPVVLCDAEGGEQLAEEELHPSEMPSAPHKMLIFARQPLNLIDLAAIAPFYIDSLLAVRLSCAWQR